MARRERRETTSGSLILTGLVLMALAGVLAAAAGFDENESGLTILFVGSAVAQCFLLTGIIAKGVLIGNREGQR